VIYLDSSDFIVTASLEHTKFELSGDVLKMIFENLVAKQVLGYLQLVPSEAVAASLIVALLAKQSYGCFT
jgi:hypothetical protein